MSRRTLFSSAEVVKACATAASAGDEYYTSVFSIGSGSRLGKKGGVRYLDLNCRAGGKEGRLNLRFRNETTVGQILPLHAEDFVPSGGRNGGGKSGGGKGGRDDGPRTRPPDRDPSFGIQRGHSGEALAPDAAPQPSGKSAEAYSAPHSLYFAAIECLDKFFVHEIERRMGEGKIVGKSSKAPPAPDTMVVGNTSIVRLYQDTISAQAAENPGMPLPRSNHITRIPFKFGEDGAPRFANEILDLGKQYRNMETDATEYEPLRFDGEPVTARNVHRIPNHSRISGIVKLDAVCIHQMGISIPPQLDLLMVELAPPHTWTASDVFGSDGEEEGEEAPAPVARPPGSAAEAPERQSEAAAAASLDSIAAGLEM
jgi:hypothetical protein